MAMKKKAKAKIKKKKQVKKKTVKRSSKRKPKSGLKAPIRHNYPYLNGTLGYKKVYHHGLQAVATLWIPKDAAVINAGGQHDSKHRASKAIVLEITLLYSGRSVDEALSGWDSRYVYKVGQTVAPLHPFSENTNSSCESGVHFFRDKKRAEEY